MTKYTSCFTKNVNNFKCIKKIPECSRNIPSQYLFIETIKHLSNSKGI